MIEYVDNDPPRGIKMKGEILRSEGMGWILSEKPEGLMLTFIHGGNWFLEDSIYLYPYEVDAFKKAGPSFLDKLYKKICLSPDDYSSRFLKKIQPEHLSSSLLDKTADEKCNLGVCYLYKDSPYTGSACVTDETGVVRLEWVLEKGEVLQYIEYRNDGKPDRIFDGSECCIITGKDNWR